MAISGNDQDMNFMKILTDGLEEKVKEAVVDRLVRKHTEKFERNLRNKLKKEIEGVTMKTVRNVHDAMQVRDELDVFIRWGDE